MPDRAPIFLTVPRNLVDTFPGYSSPAIKISAVPSPPSQCTRPSLPTLPQRPWLCRLSALSGGPSPTTVIFNWKANRAITILLRYLGFPGSDRHRSWGHFLPSHEKPRQSNGHQCTLNNYLFGQMKEEGKANHTSTWRPGSEHSIPSRHSKPSRTRGSRDPTAPYVTTTFFCGEE